MLHFPMPAWFHRVFLVFCALLSLGGIATLLVVLSQTRAEYAQLLAVETEARRRFEDVKVKLAEQELVLERLRNDPDYVETMIRRRLGYAKPDEFVFRFAD